MDLCTQAKAEAVTFKMVHNGVEYGMMQSIAEGFEVLEKVSLISTMKP